MEKPVEKKGTEVLKLDPRDMVPTVQQVIDLAPLLVESGLFPGIPNNPINKGQAVAKMLMGAEMGVSAVTSLQLIDVVKGRLRLRSQLIAARVRMSTRYDYEIKKSDDKECIIDFFDKGKMVHTSRFTIEDADRAKLIQPDSAWVKWPREMNFNRAMSAGATKVCPELLGGYEPLENEGGFDVVDGQVTSEGQPFPGDWAGFWKWCKDMGYTPEQVHELLEVSSMKVYLDRGKSMEDAEKFLRAHKAAKDRSLWGEVPDRKADPATGEIEAPGAVDDGPEEPIPDGPEEADWSDLAPVEAKMKAEGGAPGDASFDALQSASRGEVQVDRITHLQGLLIENYDTPTTRMKWVSTQAGHDTRDLAQLTPEQIEKCIEMQEGIRDRKAKPLKTR